MAKKGSRIDIGLICEECHSVNYVVEKNKVNTTTGLKLKKFCQHCRKHTFHKETKKLD
jgi:large subunit ribosomal protein L33